MKHHLLDPKQKIVASNLDDACLSCLDLVDGSATLKRKCDRFGKQRRIGYYTDAARGLAFLCSQEEADLKSTRMFKTKLGAYLDVLPRFLAVRRDEAEQEAQQLTRRIIHNLTSLNALSIQHIYDFVPQDLLAKETAEQYELIKKAMKKFPKKAAELFLRLAKNNRAMKNEFAVFRILHEGATIPHLRKHKVRKVLLNVLHGFFVDFTDHGVRVHVMEFETSIPLDYETISVAFYQIIDNAAKYVMPDSTIDIEFVSGATSVDVVFSMFSLPISKDEVPRLCEDGYSGKVPDSLGLAGDGIGMFRTQQLLKLNNADVLITPNTDSSKATSHNGMPYELNEFRIMFKKGSVR